MGFLQCRVGALCVLDVVDPGPGLGEVVLALGHLEVRGGDSLGVLRVVKRVRADRLRVHIVRTLLLERADRARS